MGSLRVTGRLAWRNLWRNHRRTLIMLAAVIVGAWAMIFMTALMRGMVDDMVKDGIKTLPGHVQVHHPSYQADPSVANSITEPSGGLLEALGQPEVVAWASRIKVPAVVSSERNTRGVVLVGIDPERERDLSFVAGDMADGRFLESPEDEGLVVGRKLLERLETDLGKRVVVFLALAFGLINTLVMAVFERVREIGLMLALGMTPANIRAQIITESTILLALGLLIGDVLAWLTVKPLEKGIDLSIVGEGMEYFGAAAVLYPAFRWEDVILANVIVLVLGFLASVSPAVRASRYEPVEAITKV